jgi:hypothetical protein
MTHHKKNKISFNHVMKSIGHTTTAITKPVTHVFDKEMALGSEAIQTVGKVGTSLTLPLLIIGGIVGVYILTKN